MSPTLAIRLGFVSLELPGEWEQEITVVSRGKAIRGYRPNVRVTYATAEKGAAIEDLAREYEARLVEGVGARKVTKLREERLAFEGAEAIALSFTVEVDASRSAEHRAIIAIREHAAVTIAESRPAGIGAIDAAELAKIADSVLASLHIVV